VDDFEITMTGANAFNLTNLTTGANAGTFNFTAGTTFNLAGGFAVNITGTPAVGDRFKFSVSENAATFVKVSSTVLGNSQKIAAGNSTTGDGGNAGDLAALQSDLTFNSVTLQSGSGAFTFDEFYNALVSAIGIESASAQAGVRQQEVFFRIRETYSKRLSSFQVASRLFAALGNDVVTDALTFGQCVHAGALYRADVHENVFIAAFRLDKSKSLAGIKKLYSSNSHFWPP
jgi:flagellar hook-associated protein FlgK